MLMSRWDFSGLDIDHDILQDYIELTKTLPSEINEKDKESYNVIPPVFIKVRDELFSKYDVNDIVDTLVLHLFNKKSTTYKLSLWTCFGEEIYNNIITNLKYRKLCERCGVLIEKTSNKTMYCDDCQKEMHKEVKLASWHRNKHKY
jgi:hypothetical protein